MAIWVSFSCSKQSGSNAKHGLFLPPVTLRGIGTGAQDSGGPRTLGALAVLSGHSGYLMRAVGYSCADRRLPEDSTAVSEILLTGQLQLSRASTLPWWRDGMLQVKK